LAGANAVASIEIDAGVRGLDRSDVSLYVDGTYTDRRQMEHYHVLTNVQSGPLPDD
jgi:hypothetical protein